MMWRVFCAFAIVCWFCPPANAQSSLAEDDDIRVRVYGVLTLEPLDDDDDPNTSDTSLGGNRLVKDRFAATFLRGARARSLSRLAGFDRRIEFGFGRQNGAANSGELRTGAIGFLSMPDTDAVPRRLRLSDRVPPLSSRAAASDYAGRDGRQPDSGLTAPKAVSGTFLILAAAGIFIVAGGSLILGMTLSNARILREVVSNRSLAMSRAIAPTSCDSSLFCPDDSAQETIGSIFE